MSGSALDLSRIAHIALDMDGTIYRGKRLFDATLPFLDRLGRPIDLCVSGGKLYVVEYCRQTETAGPGSEGFGEGGRVLEVGPAE